MPQKDPETLTSVERRIIIFYTSKIEDIQSNLCTFLKM